MEIKEEIKSRISILDLVSEYVELKKAGRSYKGLCPFHNEKSPSFIVSPDKGIAYCFGCNSGGDIFAFLEKVEAIDFPEALKRLAEKANVVLPQLSSENVVKAREGRELADSELSVTKRAFELYREYFEQDNVESKMAYDYLLKRGLSPELITEFGLCFAPKSGGYLWQSLVREGVSEKLILASGLALSDDTLGRGLVDRFRGRLLIPIADDKGRVVGFGGRAMQENQNPKYLNSADSAIYNKSRILYNFDKAKEAARKLGFIVIVEGYFDVMAFWQAGVHNVVASCGTALTEEHVRLLQRFVDTVVLAFDNDSAGFNAGVKAAELAFKHDLNVRFIDFGKYKDAGEAIVEDADFLLKTTEARGVDFFDFIWQREFMPLTNVEREDIGFLSSFLERYGPLVWVTPSVMKRDLIVRKFSQFLRTEPKVLYEELQRLERSRKHIVPKAGADAAKVGGKDFASSLTTEELFWGYLWARREILSEIWPLVQKFAFVFSLNDVYNLFAAQYNGDRVDEGVLSPSASKRLDYIALYLEGKDIQLNTAAQLTSEVKLLLERMVSTYKKQQMDAVRRSIADAEASGDQSRLNELLVQYNTLVSLN